MKEWEEEERLCICSSLIFSVKWKVSELNMCWRSLESRRIFYLRVGLLISWPSLDYDGRGLKTPCLERCHLTLLLSHSRTNQMNSIVFVQQDDWVFSKTGKDNTIAGEHAKCPTFRKNLGFLLSSSLSPYLWASLIPFFILSSFHSLSLSVSLTFSPTLTFSSFLSISLFLYNLFYSLSFLFLYLSRSIAFSPSFFLYLYLALCYSFSLPRSQFFYYEYFRLPLCNIVQLLNFRCYRIDFFMNFIMISS